MTHVSRALIKRKRTPTLSHFHFKHSGTNGAQCYFFQNASSPTTGCNKKVTEF